MKPVSNIQMLKGNVQSNVGIGSSHNNAKYADLNFL